MKKTPLLLLLSSLLLTSCSLFINSYKPFSYDQNSYEEVRHEIDEDEYYQHEELDKVTYYKNKDVTSSGEGLSLLPNHSFMTSKGEAKLLVIPITFKNSGSSLNTLEERKINIQNTFFGNKEMNQYYSVAEYYERSSYGELSIKGDVTNWYTYEGDVNENSGQTTSKTIVEAALKDIANNPDRYFNNKEYNSLSNFLHDGSDYIDGIFAIYDHPSIASNNKDNIFWAYTNSVEPNSSTQIKEGIKYAHYCWASYDFMNVSFNKVDARTYIHEIGHLIGLEDYYNTSSSYQPTGCLDMMDANLGDHNAFSKMVLGWVTPKVIKEKGEISLSPFVNSGDVLLLPIGDNYKNTAFEEYLLVEYFAPTGLNNHFGSRYIVNTSDGNSHTFSYFSSYGFKVYHVSAKLGFYSSLIKHELMREDITNNNGVYLSTWYIDYVNINNGITSNSATPLIGLLGRAGLDHFKQGIPASNADLFIAGTSFIPSQYNVNSNYSFTVTYSSSTKGIILVN